jgi:endogenous inhibitor of DNA gyrase (YacG/DUF329 family)
MSEPKDQTPLRLKCPTCSKTILWNDDFPFRPFCGDRCRLIDLGEWASENHRIAGEPLTSSNDDDLEER